MDTNRIKIIHSARKQDCEEVINWLASKKLDREVEIIDHESAPSVGDSYKVYKTPTLVRENGELVTGERRMLQYLKGYFGR